MSKTGIYNVKFIAYCVLLILLTMALSTGCQSKSTGTSPTGQVLIDDGYIPDSPKWDKNSPIALQKVSEKAYQAILDWDIVTTSKEDNTKKNVIGYNIYRRKESAIDKKIATLSSDQHYYIDKSLELIEGEKFIYTISAFDNMLRESNRSDPQMVIVQPEKKAVPKPPSRMFFAPGSSIAFGNDRGDIIISWDAPMENTDNSTTSDIVEYEIEAHTHNQTAWKQIAKVPGDKNIFIDSNLTQGTYFYRVRAKNSVGNYSQYVDGNFSIFGKIDNTAPGPVTNLEVWYQKGKNFLRWQNPVKDAEGKTLDFIGVKVYRKIKDSSEPFTLVKILPPDISYTDFNINLDNYYIYTVTTFDVSGNESIMSKPASSEPSITYLETPKNLFAKLSKNSALTLNWDAVSGAKSYNVYRSQIENGVYVKTGDSAVNSYLMSIPYGNVYYYKVSAVDEKGVESSPSRAIEVIGNILYKTLECESYLNDISKGVNAVSRPFELEVNVMDFSDINQYGDYLKFMPISVSDGESVRGVPISGKDVDAVDDYIDINQFMSSGTYKCEIWIKKSDDSGIYRIEVGGNTYGPIDCYSNNNYDILKFPVSFTVADDATYHGKNVTYKFTCLGKSENSSNYSINLDKIVVLR